VDKCIEERTEDFITVGQLWNYMPEAEPDPEEDQFVCAICNGDKFYPLSPGDRFSRYAKCPCPSSRRIPKEKAIRSTPPDLQEMLSRLEQRLKMERPKPFIEAEPDKSLGFWLEQKNGDWWYSDNEMNTRKASQSEVILWRAQTHWRENYRKLREPEQLQA